MACLQHESTMLYSESALIRENTKAELIDKGKENNTSSVYFLSHTIDLLDQTERFPFRNIISVLSINHECIEMYYL